jgi:hypothetical protein
MDSDATVISDSEPESSQLPLPSSFASAGFSSTLPTLARAMKEAAKAEKEQKKAANKGRRRTSAEREDEGEVLVLSSSDDEGKPVRPSTSHYFPDASTSAAAPSASKRRRVPSPTPAGDGWPSLAHISARPRSLSISSSESISAAAAPAPASAARTTPFVSALDLLRSTPTQPSDVEEAEEERPKKGKGKEKEKKEKKKARAERPRPTIKKTTSAPAVASAKKEKDAKSKGKKKALGPAASMSSIEIVGGEGAVAAEEEDEDDDDDRMSVASTSSARSETSALPSPSNWKARFQFGSTSSRESLAAAAPAPPSRKPSLERFRAGSASERGEDDAEEKKPKSRKNPWDDMESLIKQHKSRAAKLVSDAKSKKVEKRVKAESLMEKEDENILVLDGDTDEDSVLKPLPNSSSRSRSRSDGTLKKPHLPSFAQDALPSTISRKPSLLDLKPSLTSDRKPKTSLSFLPTPLTLPSPDRLKPLLACPVCLSAWGASKTAPSRQTHLRTCAAKEAHSAEAIAWLVDEAILRLAEAAEEARREREEGLSLFDRAVGKGEGGGGWRDVTAVGVEGAVERGGGGEYFRRTVEVQAELDKGRKKIPVEKVVKLAKEIREERKAWASVGGKKEEDVAEEEGEGGGAGEEEGMPRATGRLRPDSSTQRAAVASRAGAVLGLSPAIASTSAAGAPVLPLSPSAASTSTAMVLDPPFDLAALSSPPRPTQGFEQSYLAAKCQSDGTAEVVVLPSKHSRRSLGADEGDEAEAGSEKSLWKTAAGKDESVGVLEKVVVSFPRCFCSLSAAPSNREN